VQIKTFEADNVTQALKAAKEAFGPEAVILGVKTSKPSGRFMGKWKKHKVTLTAATDTSDPDDDKMSISKERPLSVSPSPPILLSSKAGAPGSAVNNRGAAIRTFARSESGSSARDMLPAGYVKKLFWLQQQMLMAGVAEACVNELMIVVHTVAVRRTHLSEEILMGILEEVIEDRIRLRPKPHTGKGLPKRMVFVGPTGVGKTTTIAKIATIYSHRRRSSIGLITLDEQRIGGISQLAIYARILGIPMKAASSPLSLRKALRALSGKQLILVDTAGVNPHDPEQLKKLELLMAEIEKPHIHLVLSTTTKAGDLTVLSNAFQCIPVGNYLFTKLDESTTQGNILSRAIQSGIPLSYYADGRKIPDDIHVMTAQRLMRMIFNETTLRRAKSASPEILAERLGAFEDQLEKHPLKFRPYRTFSTEWDSNNGKTPYAEYTHTANSSGGR
jgi:flagellar biosynthesis protein FlhF